MAILFPVLIAPVNRKDIEYRVDGRTTENRSDGVEGNMARLIPPKR
jgi:hypothetical protein